MNTSEPIAESGTCKRRGRKTSILSNGLCLRYDNVLYRQKENSSPWGHPSYPPRKKQHWC